MIDKFFFALFGAVDKLFDKIDKFINTKRKKKMIELDLICKDCHHECHCDGDLHADEYGLCTCEECKCGKSQQEE